MSKKCKSKEDYKVTCRDFISKGKHSEIYCKVLFKEGEEYYFTNKGKDYYVATDEKYLRDIKKWNLFVEEMNEDVFNEYFSFEGKPINNKPDELIDSVDLNLYNELINKLYDSANLGGKPLTIEERALLQSVDSKLGFGEKAGFFKYQTGEETNITKYWKTKK